MEPKIPKAITPKRKRGASSRSLDRMVSPAANCPKCGGDGGVQYTMLIQTTRHCDWSGVSQEVDAYVVRQSKTGKCVQCKARVSVPQA